MVFWISAARAILATVVVSIVCATPAFADDCPPLTIDASVELLPNADKTQEFVPVTIGTTDKHMLVDTGASYSVLTPEAVQELGLTPYHNFHFIQQNVAGEQSDLVVQASPFRMGTLSAPSMEFALWVGPKMSDDPKLAGALGANILRNYDVDLDFGGNKLNLISPDHCEGKVVYWPADAVAVVPVRIVTLGSILLPVTLDGHQITALLDTGSSGTVLMRRVAEGTFALTMGDANTPAVGAFVDLKGATTYRHRFASLGFEGIAIGNVDVDIIPDMSGDKKDSEVGTHIFDRDPNGDHPDMLLGMDVLRRLHVYIAYKEQKLYITPASSPAPAPAADPSSSSH